MRTPMGLIRALLAMLPRLQAEDAVHAVTVGALGAGTMEKYEAQRVMHRLLRAARPRVTAHKAAPADLAAVGIGYHVVEASHHGD
jgi:uncharacterized protein involved in response to NO